MTVRVLFFGPGRQIAGTPSLSVSFDQGADISSLLTLLKDRFPALREVLPNWRIAVNGSYASEQTVLQDGDEVALIPPVSGGSGGMKEDLVRVTDQPVDVSALLDWVQRPHCGAIVLFLGTVRDHNLGRWVRSITYEAYQPMAEKELNRIISEIRRERAVGSIAVVHRVGRLGIGDIAVAIAVSAPHRDDAFAAARYAIERIKEMVPIWKLEEYEDGEREWLAGTPGERAE